jgi:methionyl aminopeptidase
VSRFRSRVPQATKTPAQIELMRTAGSIVREAHEAAAAVVGPGVTTAEIDAVVDDVIASHGAEQLFKGQRVPGTDPFPAATCVSVNQEIVHGIPGPRKLRGGDIVSIDIGVRYEGWCADAAVTHPVGEVAPKLRKLVAATEGALRIALETLRPNIRWSEVAKPMEEHVRLAGFHVIESLCGHGIGRQMWEAPQVPNYFSPSNDFELTPGLVLAIEPMVALGTTALRLMPDGWTIETADGRPAAHFEHTVAITDDGVSVLTTGRNGWG